MFNKNQNSFLFLFLFLFFILRGNDFIRGNEIYMIFRNFSNVVIILHIFLHTNDSLVTSIDQLMITYLFVNHIVVI